MTWSLAGRSPEEIAEEDAFLRLYGPWAPLEPAGLADFMAGFDRPWWIVGGWAVDAFTGESRDHEDIDLSILSCDVPALRSHVGDRWHLWSNHGGTLRPLTDRHPEVLDVESQIWIREHAAAPWIIDLPLTPDCDGLWTNKRLPSHVAPVDQVTWVAHDGIRYLSPEIVLFFKARLGRPKDDDDLARVWPLLTDEARGWLAQSLGEIEPEHPWLQGVVKPAG